MKLSHLSNGANENATHLNSGRASWCLEAPAMWGRVCHSATVIWLIPKDITLVTPTWNYTTDYFNSHQF